jgi:hypothetical protein
LNNVVKFVDRLIEATTNIYKASSELKQAWYQTLGGEAITPELSLLQRIDLIDWELLESGVWSLKRSLTEETRKRAGLRDNEVAM